MNGKNYLAIGVTVGIVVVGSAVGYGTLRGDVGHNTEDIIEVKGEVKETKEDIEVRSYKQIEIDTRQEMLLQSLEKFADRMEEKLNDHRP